MTKAPIPRKEASATKSSGMYPEAYYSPKIAKQVLTKNAYEIVPVDQSTSPSNFIIRLFVEVSCLVYLMSINEGKLKFVLTKGSHQKNKIRGKPNKSILPKK